MYVNLGFGNAFELIKKTEDEGCIVKILGHQYYAYMSIQEYKLMLLGKSFIGKFTKEEVDGIDKTVEDYAFFFTLILYTYRRIIMEWYLITVRGGTRYLIKASSREDAFNKAKFRVSGTIIDIQENAEPFDDEDDIDQY